MTGNNNWLNWYKSLSINDRIAYKVAMSTGCDPVNIAELNTIYRNWVFFAHFHNALVYMGYRIYQVPAMKCKKP